MTPPPPGGYGAPPYRQQPPAHAAPQRPAIWQWYVAYTFGMTLVFIFLFLGGLGRVGDNDPTQRLAGVGLIAASVPLAGMHLVAPFLPKTPGVWTYHLVVIGVGIAGACCLPVTIPLLVFWLKPETKRFFGRV